MHVAVFCIFVVLGGGYIEQTTCEGDNELSRHGREIQTFSVAGKDVNVTRIVPQTNSYSQCYVSVVVYNSTSLTNPTSNATVTIISRSGTNHTGFSQVTTDAKGQACLLVHCYVEGIVFVEKGSERLFAADVQKQRLNLPTAFRVDIQSNSEEVVFHSFVFGKGPSGKSGPVYNSRENNACMTDSSNNYHFSFSYLSIPDQLTSTPVPTSLPPNPSLYLNPGADNTWFYGPFQDPQTCYMKIKMKIGNIPAELHVRSRIGNQNGQNLGLFISGPKADPTNPTEDKVACLLFRCPTVDIFAKHMNTFIDGTLLGTTGCTVKGQVNPDLNVTPTTFSGVIPTMKSLSPKEGLFQDVDPAKARARCLTGRDFLGTNYVIEIDSNFAFEYDCTVPSTGPLPVLG